jgi:membrane protein YdbS with pleckstrin-like domain
MYEQLTKLIFPLLKADTSEPPPPAGYDPHEFMRTMRAAPSYLRYRLFFWKLYAAAWSIGILALCFALIVIEPLLTLLVIPIIIIAALKAATLYVVTRLDYEMRWYIITERSMLIRQGAWVVREITLTFANAQNVRVTQGPLERYFGFSNVEIDTAGGGGGSKEESGVQRHRAVLRGLENPAEVRDMILDLLRRHRGTGLGDPDDLHRAREIPEALDGVLVNEIWKEAKLLRAAVEKRSDIPAPDPG